ncbi:MAG: hypothetical protein KME56_18355 [Candidatus Thiodiazotropha sp. (ex Ctena orbiculata)]|nr:hypothetical protein [Candidatus Thiodiazotropha taylori]MBT2998575.1 hypothetical protein [Candidatus Thiodiazotropha taylori]MBT3002749.1 hypothetical protein [Candidatus Thiodiazotropha taylori]MBV2109008.1 hypothetical protein [Candidatus Thiodiazotropha taylori]MBV2113035.1 hypothetical protein [Candidatus Thiodiazotropha taylori]
MGRNYKFDDQSAAKARKYQRKLKNLRLEKRRKHKSIERKAIILYLRNKSPDEILKYIESDDTRSIYYYPEQYADIDNYDLMKLDWGTRYELWKRLLSPPINSIWEKLAKQLLDSIQSEEDDLSIQKLLNRPLAYGLIKSEHRSLYMKLFKKLRC